MSTALCVDRCIIIDDIENAKNGLPEGNIWIEGLSFEKMAGYTSLRDRSECESDPNYIQIIPYIIVATNAGDMVLKYTRTKMSAEGRLHGASSIGWGGHVEKQPMLDYFDPEYDFCFERVLAKEAAREIHEEIGLRPAPAHWRNTLHDWIRSKKLLDALTPNLALKALRYGWVEDYFFEKLKNGDYRLLYTNEPGASQHHLAVVMVLNTDLIEGDLELSFNEGSAALHSFVQIHDLAEQTHGEDQNLEPWSRAILQRAYAPLGDHYILQKTGTTNWLYRAEGGLREFQYANTAILTTRAPWVSPFVNTPVNGGQTVAFEPIESEDELQLPHPLYPISDYSQKKEKAPVLTNINKTTNDPQQPV